MGLHACSRDSLTFPSYYISISLTDYKLHGNEAYSRGRQLCSYWRTLSNLRSPKVNCRVQKPTCYKINAHIRSHLSWFSSYHVIITYLWYKYLFEFLFVYLHCFTRLNSQHPIKSTLLPFYQYIQLGFISFTFFGFTKSLMLIINLFCVLSAYLLFIRCSGDSSSFGKYFFIILLGVYLSIYLAEFCWSISSWKQWWELKLIFIFYRIIRRHCVKGVRSQPGQSHYTLCAVTRKRLWGHGVRHISTSVSICEICGNKRYKT
jgi:hypothetical protein